MTLSRSSAVLAFGLTAVACSASTSPGTTSSGGAAGATTTGSTATTTTGNGGAGGTGTSLFDAGFGGGGGSVPGGCTPDQEAMYLFGGPAFGQPALYKFVPATTALTMVGPVTCAAVGSPFSMSVDKNGVAWALYDSGQLFKVDTKTAACSATGFLSGQKGFTTFGMGFVSDKQDSASEMLFITQADLNPSADQLGAIDTTKNPPTISLVGKYNGGNGMPPPFVGAADATGTGDGRLFGFFRTSPVKIAQIDKATAQILGVADVPGVTIGAAWAFAFWGGTFWLFTWDGFSPSGSKLQQYDPTTQMVSLISSGIGFVVVGAGVSTCAPLVPPK